MTRADWRVSARRRAVAIIMALGTSLGAAVADAQVTRVEVTARQPDPREQPGRAGAYEILRGRIHGEVDPSDPHNAIIQDLQFAPRNARGKVEYVATFALAKPIDLAKASGVLVYQVVNRGNGSAVPNDDGDISLVSGWQGDVVATPSNQTIQVPVAKNPDGSAITGRMIARFYNVPDGQTASIRLSSMGAGTPIYPPADLEQPSATLTSYTSETAEGIHSGAVVIPRSAWAFADCRDSLTFPGKPDPTRICLKDGFDPAKVYELVYTVKDPLVLGIGLAATRDIVSFFRHATGPENPVAGVVTHAIAVGDSQSGNLIKTFIHLGFNQDLSQRIVWDGVFPRIAARQTPINFRFALPGGAATLYEPGSEPIVWWGQYEDKKRGLKPGSLLDRCLASKTCPKVIEAFGSSEFWGLRMSPGLIGTDAKTDIPLPANVRRYYYPGTTHGGGRSVFHIESAGRQPGCTLDANPNPEADTTRALTRALIDWVTRGVEPPPSRYPKLANGELVAPANVALGVSAALGVNGSAFNPVLDYDYGPEFNAADLSGVMTVVPPRIRQVIPTYVPKVSEDGNETTGVPSVQHQAPLGTYLGWNITSSGFFAGQGCGFAGGYVPFAKTQRARLDAHDSRLSVEERYGTLEGYICVVERAVSQAVKDRFLLEADAVRLRREVRESRVLPPSAESSPEDRAIARGVCQAK